MVTPEGMSFILTCLLAFTAAISSGLLMRLLVDPNEALKLKTSIIELERSLPPRYMRDRKREKKARMIESELRRLRKAYTKVVLKRITALMIVYTLSLIAVLYLSERFVLSPIKLPLLTYEMEGRTVTPTSTVFVLLILVLLPLTTWIAEYVTRPHPQELRR